MFKRKNPVRVLDLENHLWVSLPLEELNENFPGVRVFVLENPDSGKVEKYVFVSDIPDLYRPDYQEVFWRKLTKWLLSPPSPSKSLSLTQLLLLMGFAFATGLIVGGVF